MLRVLGITGRPPRKENRIIFYSILFVLIATLFYILSYYIGAEEKSQDRKDPGTEKRTSFIGGDIPKTMIDKSFPLSWQER